MRTRLKWAQTSGKWICFSPVKGWRGTHSDGSKRKGYYKSPINCYHPPNYTPGYHKCSPAFRLYTNHYHDSLSQQLPSVSRSSLRCETRPVTGSYLSQIIQSTPSRHFLVSVKYYSINHLPISLPFSDFPFKIKYPFPPSGARGSLVVMALHYKPAGRGFDSRWCHWNFSVT